MLSHLHQQGAEKVLYAHVCTSVVTLSPTWTAERLFFSRCHFLSLKQITYVISLMCSPMCANTEDSGTCTVATVTPRSCSFLCRLICLITHFVQTFQTAMKLQKRIETGSAGGGGDRRRSPPPPPLLATRFKIVIKCTQHYS